MKIAMMVRGYLTVPRPPGMIYAPIDLAHTIATGLAKRGHEIDFYAPVGSKIKSVSIKSHKLRPLAVNQEEFQSLILNPALMTHYIPFMWDSRMSGEMFIKANKGEYDLLHFHHPESALPFTQIYKDVPVAYTLHDPIYDWYQELFELYQQPNQHFISISNNQRRDAPDLPYAGTVYNGIDLNDYPFSNKPDDYLLYSGRIVPEKGVKEAVQVALKSHHRLLIIGSISPDNQGYFDRYIKPHLGDQILYLGYMQREMISRYYRKAKAVLTPVQWEEPFGLTTIEAMASGSPVISFKRGASQEIIIDQKTGFLVEGINGMVEAVNRVSEIKRKDCRDRVAKNFSVEMMVEGYEKVFEQILRDRKKISPQFVKRQIKKVPLTLKTSQQKHHLKKVIKRTTKTKG